MISSKVGNASNPKLCQRGNGFSSTCNLINVASFNIPSATCKVNKICKADNDQFMKLVIKLCISTSNKAMVTNSFINNPKYSFTLLRLCSVVNPK